MSLTDKQNARGGTNTMFSRLRKRVTYTNVAMTLALVFAMTGGAFAASKFVITSTKQIKPSVLKQLQGKTGKTGAAGANGAPGANGAQGPAGANGKDGAPGLEGKQGPEGKEGKAGTNGKTGFTKTLPSGETETGSWYAESSSSASKAVRFAISFAIPLEAPLSVNQAHKVTVQEAKENKLPKGCTGTPEAPGAEAGNLCIFEGGEGGAFTSATGNVLQPGAEGAGGVGVTGALVTNEASAEGEIYFGTWAVTAP